LKKSEVALHRGLGARCFNGAWELLVKRGRTSREDLLMLELAHASRFHWGLVGTARNQAIADWQVSRVYVELGEPGMALRYAEESLKLCEDDHMEDLVHTAHEGLARALALRGDVQRAQSHLDLAAKLLEGQHLNAEDKKVYLDQIKETKGLLRGRRQGRRRTASGSSRQASVGLSLAS
jgi:hypothetical protein